MSVIKKQRCDVVMLVDVEMGEVGSRGGFVLDRGTMERHVFKALRAAYREVAVVPFGPDIPATLQRLRELKPRIVFNLTEWVDSDRTQDYAIAALLDMMKFKYTGSGPAGLQRSRDKAGAQQRVAAAGVDVPQHFTLRPGQPVVNPGLPYPLIVKPQLGDGSDEISKLSLVRSERELKLRARSIWTRLKEPLICEEYIPGRDIYVGLLGNEPRVLAPTEMVVGSRGKNAPTFATYRIKNDGAYRTKWRVSYRLAQLPAAVRRQVQAYSVAAFHALQMRDYGRLDYRLTDEGRLVFIEANPNSDLTPNTLGRDLCFVGIPYEQLIPQIVETALKRYRSRR